MSASSTKPVSFDLHGKVAIVTGSGKNIGKSIAVELARYGADVVLNGLHDRAALEATQAEIERMDRRAVIYQGDIGSRQAASEMVDLACSSFGKVDIVVCNAAIRPHQPMLTISEDDWNHVLQNNLSSAFFLAQVALPGMLERGWGRFIHISGMDGFTGHTNRAHNVVCKAGIHALGKCIGQEFGPQGVTANTVAPGWIDTERDWSKYPNIDYEVEKLKIPARRIGDVTDISSACLFLASESAGYVNGQVIHVNGGWHMY